MTRKNAGITVCLMVNDTKIPECSEEKHLWVAVIRPEGNNSGWHADECKHCGVTRTYDTSD